MKFSTVACLVIVNNVQLPMNLYGFATAFLVAIITTIIVARLLALLGNSYDIDRGMEVTLCYALFKENCMGVNVCFIVGFIFAAVFAEFEKSRDSLHAGHWLGLTLLFSPCKYRNSYHCH